MALILLFAKDKGTEEDIRWQINGGFDTEAAEVMIRIAEKGITEEKWYKIFEIIEYFVDAYYSNKVIKKLVDKSKNRRKGALAEMLNAQFLGKSGYKDYDAEVLTLELEAVEDIEGMSYEINGIVTLRRESKEQEIILEVMDIYRIKKLEDLDKAEGKETLEIIKDKLKSLSLRLEKAPVFSFRSEEKEIKNKKVIFIFSLSNQNVNRETGEAIIEEIRERMKKFIVEERLSDIIEDVIYGRIDEDLLRKFYRRGLEE